MLTRRLVEEGIAPTVTLSVRVDQQMVQVRGQSNTALGFRLGLGGYLG